MNTDNIKFHYNLYKAKGETLNIIDVEQWAGGMLKLLVPELNQDTYADQQSFEKHVAGLSSQLKKFLSVINVEGIDEITDRFFNSLQDVSDKLEKDFMAFYEGDPAAKSLMVVKLTYPGVIAIVMHRVANVLYALNVAIIPRVLSEYAHSKTGIDIHPGATIGDSFCIDHGTGIVIGETTEIGKHVKIYQGVTLGALSVKKEDAKAKRHPTIEDNVVIYAGATILGGKTVIGESSIVGGNVWVTESVSKNSKIYYK
ncbi:MAG: serine acetyltransferase [Flavobacteriales bacterium]|nr:serine acetyltransferase [Flavobacteriales bacterium]